MGARRSEEERGAGARKAAHPWAKRARARREVGEIMVRIVRKRRGFGLDFAGGNLASEMCNLCATS